jgi:hypothetical protein
MKRILIKIPHIRLLISLDKRQRFAIQTIILTSGLLVTQLIWEDYRFLMVGILSLLSYVLTAWSLKEDIKGIEWILLFILPVVFTASVSLFYFLLPSRWIIRLFLGIIFAVGIYAGLLVENIYNVAAVRSIGLLRAAHSIGLLLTLVVLFLSSNIIFSMRASFWANFHMFIPVVSVLSLQSLWTVKLEEKISRQVISYSVIVSLLIGEGVLALSFWPIQKTVASLFITASFYAIIGIFSQHILDRLFRNTIKEYLIVFLFTFFILYITTKWG